LVTNPRDTRLLPSHHPVHDEADVIRKNLEGPINLQLFCKSILNEFN
jgi:hypothetical protein